MKIPESSNEKKAVSSGSCGSEVWERTWLLLGELRRKWNCRLTPKYTQSFFG
jgi:hypothetical protein